MRGYLCSGRRNHTEEYRDDKLREIDVWRECVLLRQAAGEGREYRRKNGGRRREIRRNEVGEGKEKEMREGKDWQGG